MQTFSIRDKACWLLSSGAIDEALAAFKHSIHVEGETPLSWHYLASAYARAPNQMEQCVAAHRRAAELADQEAVYHLSYGLRLVNLNRFTEALGAFESALAIDPRNSTARFWVLRLRRSCLLWHDAAQEEAFVASLRDTGSALNPLISLSVVDDPELQLNQARRAARNLQQVSCDVPLNLRDVPLAARSKIRVGYVSADYFTHATMLLMNGVFAHHDKSRFEIIVYDLKPNPKAPESQRLRKIADTYVEAARLSDPELVARMREDALDIAVDLKGHTVDSRMAVFRARVAPVQVSYLGYPGTTGLDEMDYMLADAVTIPPELRKHYSEKILYMPHCYQPNDNMRPLPSPIGARADYGLPDDAVVLASFNHPNKVSPAQFDLWMAVMRRLPQTVLWFYSGGADVSARLAHHAEARGVAASRLIVSDRVAQTPHMARMGHADICLDSSCYNAHTTASDAVWAGVPMVTMIGQQFAARVGASILKTVGLPELVAEDEAGYMRILEDLVTDTAWRHALRDRLRERRLTSPLFDTEGYTRDFEALLEKAHQHRLSGAAPSHMSLDADDPMPHPVATSQKTDLRPNLH